MTTRCGGYTTTSRVPNDEERAFLTSDVVRQLIESETIQTAGGTESNNDSPPKPKQLPISMDPVLIKTQVVAGMNYHVKYRITSTQQRQEVDGEKTTQYVHAKIYKPLPHTSNPPTLLSFVDNCTESAELS